MAQSVLVLEVHVDGSAPADLAARSLVPAAKPREELDALARLFGGLSRHNCKVFGRMDSASGVAAARTIAITGANIAAAEWIGIYVPGIPAYRLTAVSSGAVDGDGTFNVSGTDSTCAENIKGAINSLPGLKDYVVATRSSGNLIVTASAAGTAGNSITVIDGTGNGISSAGALSGGLDPTQRVTGTVVITHANITDGDTLTIGATTFTWRTTPTLSTEIQIGGSATADGDNLVTTVNAHVDTKGIVLLSNASGTVTVTYTVDPRTAVHIRLATSDATAMTLTQPSSTLTLSCSQIARTYLCGAA